MKRRMRSSKTTDSIFPLKVDEFEKILRRKFENNPDLLLSKYEHKGNKMIVFSIPYLVAEEKAEDFILKPLLNKDIEWTNENILNEIPLGESKTFQSLEKILDNLLLGGVFIYIEGENEVISYLLLNKEKRNLEKAETESLVLGPKLAFTESLFTNLNIVRFRIRSTDLVLKKITIGKTIPREVRLIYMKSIANEEDVNTMRQRLLDLDVDEIEDSVILKQYLEDSSTNLFPQFESTELPDRLTYGVTKGKIGVLVENSPMAIVAPANLFSFLESTEDLYMRWHEGTFLRLLRIVALFFSFIITPLYVAVATYQFGLIPTQLLISLGESRAQVPFPPLLEALILEFLMELLREAGARLPTKVGQTMGIVGGIVIGQAAVEAGITSNILIIVVAMSALASFTSPSYFIGTTVRVIRFPLILLAGLFGILGIIFGLSFLTIHLIRLTSLGRPYLLPLYPLHVRDFNKVFYRTPISYKNKLAKAYQPKRLIRFPREEAAKKQDIDE
ncbi:spore germination protein [Virgibacillus alimentarius]|uniref:Spore germination protein n=1 Tax=Virgibacillus alimentarius TaxID=698769 RepID=A0ABS4SB85_9BACI|nr:spore germination protein [Virgibacillus alimentarius]MBP2258768.1 hypothetical protein [Virgibacillus alimentarius]